MKIATWNVNSIRARHDRVLAWLDDRQPDVLCMQETKVVDGDFPAGELEERGYHCAIHGQKSYNGVAIVAREPLEDVRRGFDDGGDDDCRLIAATVGGLRVLSAYVPNGQAVGSDKYRYKLEWLARLRAHLERAHDPAEPLALVGDFNVAPDDRDVYDPALFEGRILCSEPERRALAAVVSWGLSDALRLHHPDPGLYSWWDYRQLGFAKNRGLRIDHIYLTAPLAALCTAAHVDRDARKGKLPSDHAPVLAEIGTGSGVASS
jgi:exodeoxyribonuclease III